MKYIVGTLAILLCLGCQSSKQRTDEYARTAALVKDQVTQKDILITAEWALPLASLVLNQIALNNGLGPGNTGNRINVQGNRDFLRIKNDSVTGGLSYFGERRMSGDYNAQQGIRFKDVASDYTQVFNEQKERYEISFNVSEGSERFDIYLEINLSGSTRITLDSAYRTNITYTGSLEETDKKGEEE